MLHQKEYSGKNIAPAYVFVARNTYGKYVSLEEIDVTKDFNSS